MQRFKASIECSQDLYFKHKMTIGEFGPGMFKDEIISQFISDVFFFEIKFDDRWQNRNLTFSKKS